MIFFSRLEFVPAQINGQKSTIAARDLGLWVGCTAVLLYCLLYRDPRSMPPNTVRTSSQLSTPAHLVCLFFFTVPLASEVVLNGGRAGASGPRPSGALVCGNHFVVMRGLRSNDRYMSCTYVHTTCSLCSL